MFLLAFTLLILRSTARVAPQVVGDDNDTTFECFDLQIAAVHVMIQTSGIADAKTKNSPDACMTFEGGEHDGEHCQTLYELVDTDFLKNKASWWELDGFNGREICEITKFTLKAGGTDGLAFTKLVVLVVGSNEKVFTAVYYSGDSLWIDTNDGASKQTFEIEPDFGKPKPDATDANVEQVIFIVQSVEDSDQTPILHIKSNNVDYHDSLVDHAGDDFHTHRTDIWEFDDKFEFMKVNKIGPIWILPSSSDQWGFDRTAILIKTNLGYYVPVLENARHDLDTEEDGMDKVTFPMVPGWDEETYLPEDLERGGYWKYVESIDPWDVTTLAMTASFTSEEGKIEEESRMDSFSETYHKGGSFQMCEKSGFSSGVYSGEEEGCASVDWSHDTTNGWETTVATSVETRSSQTLEYTCSHELQCPHNTIINDDNIHQEEGCYVYQWVTFTYNEVSGRTEMLETCEVELQEIYGNTPQCVPGTCIEDTDCQECHAGPSPPQTPDDVSVGTFEMLSQHFMDTYWVYGILSVLLSAAFYFQKNYKFVAKNEEHYEQLNMAKIDVCYST